MEPTLSIVVPALNEEGGLQAALESAGDGVERIVVDGGSEDATAAIAEAAGARLFRSPPGRARQMNLGAANASGDILLFLHADCRLPDRYAEQVREILADCGTACGAFRLRIDAPGGSLRFIEWFTNHWRSRLWRMPYGDQALFVRSETFRDLGGFPELPIMEDFELVRRLRRAGRIVLARSEVAASARRWQRRGPFRTMLLNQFIVGAYLLGADPERLRRIYRRTG